MLENIEKPGEYIRMGKIATYQDMAYYVLKNDLMFLNIDSGERGKISHIEGKENNDGKLDEICDLMIYKGKKVIYKVGDSRFVMDLEQGLDSVCKININSESGKCYMNGDYLYYVKQNDYRDSLNRKHPKIGYYLMRYGIENNEETEVSVEFEKHHIESKLTRKIELEGIYENNFFCIIGAKDAITSEQIGFYCCYININDSNAEPKRFNMVNLNISQIEQYKNFLIYVNVTKGCSLMKLDFTTDKRNVLLHNYGKSEKTTFIEKLSNGNISLMKPLKYMRLGNWIWIKEKDNSKGRRIPIEN